MKIYGRGRSAQFVPRRLPDEQEQRRLTSCPEFIQTSQDNPTFLYCIFLLPEVKTALRGERFQDVEDMKRDVTNETQVVLLEAFADCFQNHFERNNNVFK
jgi:hypothetical protein